MVRFVINQSKSALKVQTTASASEPIRILRTVKMVGATCFIAITTRELAVIYIHARWLGKPPATPDGGALIALPPYYQVECLAKEYRAPLVLIIIWFFCFWLPTNPITPSAMNYASLVAGSVVLFNIFYYFVWGKKYYTGPVVEIW